MISSGLEVPWLATAFRPGPLPRVEDTARRTLKPKAREGPFQLPEGEGAQRQRLHSYRVVTKLHDEYVWHASQRWADRGNDLCGGRHCQQVNFGKSGGSDR